MEELFWQHDVMIKKTKMTFVRRFIDSLPWNKQLIGITGFRGVGKTTILLQYIKHNYGNSTDALYISLDNLYFTNNTLTSLVHRFIAKGGKHLFVDEVHKYPNWSIELKNIYDTYTDLRVVFTGSSLLEILNSSADLSRRALIFELQGLSFREFIQFTTNTELPTFSLDEIINSHIEIANEITEKIKPLAIFDDYLAFGYYPFFKTDKDFFNQRLMGVINMVIEIEMPLLRGVSVAKIQKIKQLLYVIAQSVPFKPNISKLATKIGVTRNTLIEYIKILVETKILNMIVKGSFGISLLQKPDKLFLDNTNIASVLSRENTNKGNMRETFFLNQLSYVHEVNYPDKADFIVNNKYYFEVGGRSKSQKQIEGLDDAFIVSDDIEIGFENKIPLWLFGFMY